MRLIFLLKEVIRFAVVECKNYSSPIGIEKIETFHDKLSDVGYENNGLFVVFSGLTDGASDYAKYHRIEVWEHDEVAEKFLAIFSGRAVTTKGMSETLKQILPINVNYKQATSLELLNKEKVLIDSVELICHPYFKIEYSFHAQVYDPTKKIHRFSDREIVFIDALDGQILNQSKDVLSTIVKTLKIISSTTAKGEDQRKKVLIEEMKTAKPLAEYSLDVNEDYKVIKYDPTINFKQATEHAIDYAIKKNTHNIIYTPKGELLETKKIKYVPKRNKIRILLRDIFHVPKWSINYTSIGSNYSREILAYSGKVLEDTINYCPKHYKIGSTTLNPKKIVAVCEICGQSYCEEHVKTCPVCGKWVCDEHAIECSVCKRSYCKEHIDLSCPICHRPLCYACVVTCQICGKKYGENHSVICEKCSLIVCPDCIKTTGVIRKTKICIKCFSMPNK